MVIKDITASWENILDMPCKTGYVIKLETINHKLVSS